MSTSRESACQHRKEVVRYLRRDLEIARTLAKLKSDQARVAAGRVADLEARLAGEAGEDPAVPDLVLPPGAARQTALVEETVVFTELDVALGRTVAEVASKEDS